MNKKLTKYYVHYGHNTGVETCYGWRDASKFIRHCLDTGVSVRTITKEV